MSNKNYWLKSGLINLVQNGVSVLLGFFSFYLLVRLLSVEEYGTWVLFLSVTSVVELSRNGLTQDALVKFLSAAKTEDKVKINTAVFSINMISTSFVILLILSIAPWLGKLWSSGEIVLMLHLYIVTLVVSSFQNQFNCNEQANLNFIGIFYSNVVKQLVFFLYVLYCVLTGIKTDVVKLTIVQIISVLLATIIAFIYARKDVSIRFPLDMPWFKRILNFGKYTFGTAVSTYLATYIDQMMLGSMVSKSASGIYNIAIRVLNLANIPTITIATIVFPQSSRRIATGGNESLKYLFERSVGVILAIMLPFITVLFVFADYIIPFIASEKYVQAIPLLRITLIGAILVPYAMQTGVIFTSAGKTKFNFHLVIINTILIIILNAIAIPVYGIIGAAYASLVSGIIGTAIGLLYLRKLCNVNIWNTWIYAYKIYPELYRTYILKK